MNRILKKELFSKYDYIIIDCLPSLGILLTNGLAAADSLIIPVQAQKFALDGLVQLEQVYDMVKVNVNPELKIDGVILTRIKAVLVLTVYLWNLTFQRHICITIKEFAKESKH